MAADVLEPRFPLIFGDGEITQWLKELTQTGRSLNTLAAYTRVMSEYVAYCNTIAIACNSVTSEHIAGYINTLLTRPNKRTGQKGMANASIQQSIVAVRLYYDFLIERGLREKNPVRRGIFTSKSGFAGKRRGLLPHYRKLPWIPNDEEWCSLLAVMCTESIRNQFMFALAYEAGLRREELCALEIGDIDPSRRLITLRAETTKGRQSRVVAYSHVTGELYASYLAHRYKLGTRRGLLFLSESKRNKAQPITKWSWSKIIQSVAERARVSKFSTHTLRHLCFTDLARSDWDIHEIATFAGHKNVNTTLLYIHLSGRDISEKLAKGMNAIRAWRISKLNIKEDVR